MEIFKIVKYGSPPEKALEIITDYIDNRGVDVNTCGHCNYEDMKIGKMMPLLHMAICKGHLHIVKLLIEKGADIRADVIYNNSALDMALLEWFKEYMYKKTHITEEPTRLLPLESDNMSSYYHIWPRSKELRYYYIVKYIISCGGTLNTINRRCLINMIGLFEYREKLQNHVNWLLSEVINVQTRSNIGTQIINTLHISLVHYLTYDDIEW